MGFRLGAFELLASIAQGGMGEVWRGVHVGTRLPVAVKVVTAQRATDPAFRAAFRDEVRAMARLSHPGIVTVLDYGEIPGGAPGRLTPRSPYLVMEWVGNGSLARVGLVNRWETLQYLLLRLLDALAHAHARGVIHRDIKPGNVLLDHAGGKRGLEVKLTDFGIAHARGAEDETQFAAAGGTPKYMAPEQINGSWRDQGPWTDLYSVGCLAYRLATGHPPFWRGETEDLLRSHLSAPPPPLETDWVPKAFRGWIDRMLAKSPGYRYRSAADAAYDLSRIGSGAPVTLDEVLQDSEAIRMLLDVPRAESEISGTTRPVPAKADLTATLPFANWIGKEARRPASTGGTDTHKVVTPGFTSPPVPASWRRPETAATPMTVIGAGLGLFGLRPIPLINREHERDEIWTTLRDVHDTRRARAILLRGKAGYGKSRLAEWIAQRAEEVGAATVLQATHSPMHGPFEGLGRMMAAHVRVIGLHRDEMRERTETFLRQHPARGDEEYEARALTALMSPSLDFSFRFTGPTQRHLSIYRFLQRLAAARPVMVLLDDVQWGADSIRFASFVLEQQNRDPASILLVLTMREEDLDPEDDAVEALRQLDDRSDASSLRVGSLTDHDHEALIEQLLRLEGDLARDVQARTSGNPLFAVQLVGDWVARGALELGESGFRLREGEEAHIPNDIHELWTTHIDRIVQKFEQGAQPRLALEIAAALGQEVDAVEWRTACGKGGVVVPDGLIEALVDARLAFDKETGWAFGHGMLRESLERAAREAGRWESHHRACAAMLARGAANPLAVERRALHLMAAGEYEEALDPLLQAAVQRTTTSDFVEAHELFEMRAQGLAALGVPDHDPAWAMGWARECKTLAKQGRLEDCSKLATRVETVSKDHGWTELLAEVEWIRGHINNKRGSVDEGIGHFEEGLRLYEFVGNDHGVANCLYGLGELRKMRGDLIGAIEVYEEAVRLFRAVGDTDGRGISLAGLSDACRRVGELDRALDLSREALECLRSVGNRNNEAVTLNDRGDICRALGNLEEAEDLYRKASSLLEAHGSRDAIIPRMNLAVVLIEREDYREAAGILDLAEEALLSDQRTGYLAFVDALRLPCLASFASWRDLDARLSSLVEHLDATQLVDEDLARPLELAARLCIHNGQTTRARGCLTLAEQQWRALGREAEAERLQARRKQL